MKKLKNYFPFILNILVIIIPLYIVTYIISKNLEFNSLILKVIIGTGVSVLYFLVSIGIHTILHEGGHLVAGLISGYKFLFFRVWKYTLVKDNNKFKIKHFHIPGSLGQCLMAPPPYNDGDFPYTLYNLGGFLFNIIFASFGLILFLYLDSDFLSAFFLSFFFVGIYLGITNIYPFEFLPNDGTNLKSLNNSDDSKKAFYNTLLLNELSVKKQVSKSELKKYVSKHLYKDFKEPIVQGIVSENISILIEENKLREALDLAHFLLRQKNVNIILRNMIDLDRMVIYLLLGYNDKVQKLMDNPNFKKLFNQKGQGDIERLKYMYYTLYDFDENKRNNALSNFEKLSKTQLMSSNINYDKKLIELTNKRREILDKMVVLEETTSTNDYLKELVKSDSNTEIVLSKRQSMGKGQRGNSFYSPKGGMYLSIKIKPNYSTDDLKYLTGRVAVAVKESVKLGLNRKVKIKWLNDIIYNDKKVGGILTESKLDSNGNIDHVIIGIGLNITEDKNIPDEISNIYTSFGMMNLDYSIKRVLYYLIPKLYELEKSPNISEFVRKYNNSLFKRLENITIDSSGEIVNGKLLGIDRNVDILVSVDDKTKTFSYNNSRILYENNLIKNEKPGN